MNRIYNRKGEKVYYKNKECIIIRIVDMETVSVEETESHIITTVHVNNLFPTVDKHIDNNILTLSEKDWQKAQSRYRIIQPILQNRGSLPIIDQIAKENNISVPTIYRWIKQYDEYGLVSALSGKKEPKESEKVAYPKFKIR